MQTKVNYSQFIDSNDLYNLYWLFSDYASKKEAWVYRGVSVETEYVSGIISKDTTFLAYVFSGVTLGDKNWYATIYKKYYSTLVKALLAGIKLPETIKIISPMLVNNNHFVCLVTQIEVDTKAFQNFINANNLQPQRTYEAQVDLEDPAHLDPKNYCKAFRKILDAILIKIGASDSIFAANQKPLQFIKVNSKMQQYYMDSFNSESTYSTFVESAAEFDRLNDARVSRSFITCVRQAGCTCGEHAVTNGFFLATFGGVPQSDFSHTLRDFTWSFLGANGFTKKTDISAYDVSSVFEEIKADVTGKSEELDAESPQADSCSAAQSSANPENDASAMLKSGAGHTQRSYSAIPKAAIMSGACATLLFLSLHFLGVTAKIGLFTALASATGTVGAVVISSALVAISAAAMSGVIAALFSAGYMPTNIISCSNNKIAAKSSSKGYAALTRNCDLVFSNKASGAPESMPLDSTSTAKQQANVRAVTPVG